MSSVKNARPPVIVGKPLQDLLEVVRAHGPPLPDHVDGRVAPFGARDGSLERGVAGLVVAVAEEQHRPAAGVSARAG